MQYQRKHWPLIGLVSAFTLSLPIVGFGQSHETTSTASENRIAAYHARSRSSALPRNGAASQSYAQQNFSADEFFTQADRDLVTRVETNIVDSPRTAGAAKNITISARQGVVTLGGAVPTEQERAQVVNNVEKTVGVVRVQDNLGVSDRASAESSERMTNTSTTARSAMAAPAPMTQSTRVERRAEATSRRQGSFPATEPRDERRTGVDEPLAGSGEMHEEDRTGTTGPSGTRSTSPLNTGAIDTMGRVTKGAGDEAVTENDRALVSQVRVALAGNSVLNSGNDAVHLKADNGVIYLSGWTASERERTAMAETVRNVTGVQGIVNHLEIRSGRVGAAK